MTREKSTPADVSSREGKPFPWWCPACGKQEVRLATVRHVSQIKHDGRLYDVEVSKLRVPQCGACGEQVFDNHADEQIAQALREQLGILSGEQIRSHREQLGLSQRVLAEHLGVAAETISRWENGALTQSRAMDRYLRLYFDVPAARAALAQQFVSLPMGLPGTMAPEHR